MKRYCEISCHAVVGTAFLALGLTDRVDLLSVALFISLFGLSFYRSWRQAPPLLTTSAAFRWTCLYLVVAVFDIAIFSRSLIGPAIHLILFIELVKLHQEKSDKDYFYIVILSFLKILAASSLTVDITFVATLLLFIVALVSFLMSFDIYRSERSNRVKTGEAAMVLSRYSLWTALWIVLFGVGLFFLIPRVGVGYLARASVPQVLLSGFSDTVELGQIGQLEEEFLHCHACAANQWNTVPRTEWRGIALDTFDGIRWTRKNRKRRTVRPENSNYIFEREPAREELTTFNILLEPIATTALFGPLQVRQISSRQIQGLETDKDGAIFMRLPQSDRLQYQVQSEIARRTTPDNIVDHTSAPAPGSMAMYLDLPEKLDPRLKKLADEITRGARTPLKRPFAWKLI